MGKIIIITLVSLLVIIFVILRVRHNIIKSKLYNYNTSNKDNLNGYINTLTKEAVTSTHINVLTGLIHKCLVSDWLFNNHIRGSLKGAKMMIEASQFEQAKMITDLKEYFQNTIGGQQKSLQELNQVKEEGLKLALKKMNDIFEKL